MIAIIDYGMGNIHSVLKAIESFGEKVAVISRPDALADFAKIVIPGVGAFDDALEGLRDRGFLEPLKVCAGQDKIMLGICLGMQILFESSEEALKEKGLSVMKGSVVRFADIPGRKVPHMGWNQLNIKAAGCPLLKGIEDNSYVYFCHSYYVVAQDASVVAATCDYGVEFTSIVWRKNLYGVQFHPEKSQKTGLKILKNFIELPC